MYVGIVLMFFDCVNELLAKGVLSHYPDRSFSVELDDAEIDTGSKGSLFMGQSEF
jgi:hypothetical protein